ncbi:MAG TPA: TonB-dependent receptor, partial [Planctomycetota bacterium]|nr:TonB-dependent receptor [Planctomycetota bacterium]
ARNIVDVLQKAPGFYASGYGTTAADKNLDLRGYNNGAGNGQRTLVLVDGRKTNGVTSTNTDWTTIPLENIERVEVVRGPAAALYGDAAMAGVVNIITRKGGKDTFSETRAVGGNWGTYRASANLGGTSDGLLYDVYAGVEGTEGFRDHSDYYGNNFTGRVEAPLAQGLRGFLKVGRHEDERERPGSLTKAEIDTLGRKASVITGSPSESFVEEMYFDLGAAQTLGAYGELSAFLNHTRGEAESVVFGPFGDFFIDDEYGISMLQLKHVVAPKLFGREAVFTTGLDASHERAVADSAFGGPPIDEGDYRRRLIGAYGSGEIRPFPFLVVSGSLRWDRALLDLDNDFGFGGTQEGQRALDQLSPYAGATWKILDELAAFASWGRTFKYPTRDELLGFTAATPGLDPERASTTEIGLRAWSSKWGSAAVSGFRSRVQDEIFLEPGIPFGTNVNIDRVLHTGVESELRATPAEWIELFVTHTYVRAVIEEHDNDALEGERYPVTPRLSGTVGGTLRVEGASLTILGLYTGERRLVNDVAFGFEPLPSHWILDARVAYEVSFVKVYAAVHNVFDREVIDNGGFSTSTGTERFSPYPDRSWELGGEIRF